ncbi:exocyst complex component Sec3-domain-containing protein [Geopyxis carbonaria]|nr:exocyst complex component Sec3-domain-containing protein [Geopyxis carbonaria]
MADGYRNPSPAAPASAITKAQQFEDEKRRIMQSCFHKQDTDGSLLESYITHCRVLEDSASPSEPPAPGASSDSKKQRLIFVAVRKSGRVRMHKARENANGTFSIGKTWNLDDLSAITNHAAPHDKGFTVTIIKDYYWQANSSKEKDFFISSMLKIYKKYTGGKIPQLHGFQRTELDALLGPGGSQMMELQRREEAAAAGGAGRPKTPTSNGQAPRNVSDSARPMPPQHPAPHPPKKALSAAPSIESMRPPRGPAPRPPNLQPAAPPPPPDPTAGLPSQLRAARSIDKLPGRRTPEAGPPPRPPPPGMGQGLPQMPPGPPGPPSATMYPPARPRPSEEMSRTPSGQNSRSGSRPRPPPPEAADLRRAPSQERFRTPSVNSQQSVDSRREAMEQYPLPIKPASVTPPVQSPEENQRPRSKKSNRDVASQFRLAANAYNASGVITSQSPKSRPKTPTTPNSIVAPPREAGSRTPSEQMPQIKYPPEDRSMNGNGNGNGAAYGRRPSEEIRGRPSMEDSRRPRSLSRSSREAPSGLPSPSGPPPAMPPMPREVPRSPRDAPRDPPPRSDARGRPTMSRENSDQMALPLQRPPPPKEPRTIPTLNEPVIPVIEPSRPALEPVRSSPSIPQLDPSVVVPTPPNQFSQVPALNPPEEPRSRSRSPARTRERKRRSIKPSMYLEGLDKSKMTVDIEELLQEFSWDGQRKVDELTVDVKKELSRVESSNVVINIDDDDRVEQLSELLDQAIKECEEMDGLLTLYAVELTSLNDDIFHIENQSQGLQVQTANQKTLQKELEDLLSTISISPQQMEVLKQGSLESPRGLEQIEQTLYALYKAMKTMDPDNATIVASPRGPGRRGSFSEEGVGSMRALQERKEEYRNACRAFLARMHQFMHIKFQAEFLDVGKQPKDGGSPLRPRLLGHESAYQTLWRFAGLVSFARDVDGDEYAEVQKLYERPVRQLFQEEFRDHILAWKKITKKPTQEEMEMVFTTPEKEVEHSAVSAARKLTVKKSIARIRDRGESFSSKERPQAGIFSAHESFAGAFNEIYQLVFREQNFIVEFFHLSSHSKSDFGEFLQNGAATPETRRLGDLGGMRAVEPDKVKAKLVFDFMSEIFQPLTQELQNLVDWATSTDPTQGVGIMYALEQKIANLDETNQEFMAQTLRKLHERLAGLFARFLDDQVRAIEDTKVKIKKRKGVIGFMRVFPTFTAKIEEQIPYGTTSSDELDVRDMVNEGYQKINRAMFESLQAIAKESPAVASQSVDPEDKEQLNYHIMMIENMHHYLEDVDAKGNDILEGFKTKASAEYKEHMELYIGAVIRRPVGKLLDFIESVELLLKTDPASAADIPSKPSHSKAIFKKHLANHDGKEVRKGIEQLKKRVDKHFGEGHHHDDVALSARLVEKILGRLEDEYVGLHKRILLLLVGPYKDCGLECEFMVQDVRIAFKK